MTAIGTALRRFALDPGAPSTYLPDTLGERLRPVHLEQGDEGSTVAATYTTISNTPDETLLGDPNKLHNETRIQIDVYSNDEELADTVAGRLRKRLLDAFGLLPVDDATNVYVTGMSTAGGVRDLSSIAPVDGSSDFKHRLSFDIRVGYSEP